MPRETVFVPKLDHVRVAVFGDVMLDEYVSVVPREGGSSEAGRRSAYVLRQTPARWHRPGGAANAAANAASLCGGSRLYGVVGEDVAGLTLRQALRSVGVADTLLKDGSRPTSTKLRYVDQEHNYVVRVDHESTAGLSPILGKALVEEFQEAPKLDALIVSDYGKGVVTEECAAAFIGAARALRVPVVVDPKGRDWSKYRGASLVTPNLAEASEVLAEDFGETADYEDVCRALVADLPGASVLLKLGSRGAYLWNAATKAGSEIAPVPVFRPDAVGAGDTMAAAIAVGLGAGMPLRSAAVFANAAAAAAVSKRGTATVTPDEVRAALEATEPL